MSGVRPRSPPFPNSLSPLPMKTTLSLALPTPARILKTLGIIILVLTILSLMGQYSRFVFGHGRLLGFVPEFWLDGENNIPTYFSALLLLSSSLLLGVIAHLVRHTRDTFYRHWIGLSLIFCYLSIDEISSLHERTIEPVRAVLGTGSVFYFAWVIPALALLAVFAVVYLRFFWHLPRHWKGLFAASGLVYVSGALGMELVGGWYREGLPDQNLTYAFITTIEEVLELVGVSLFIYTLLGYLRAHVSTITLLLDANASDPAAAPTASKQASSNNGQVTTKGRSTVPDAASAS